MIATIHLTVDGRDTAMVHDVYRSGHKIYEKKVSPRHDRRTFDHNMTVVEPILRVDEDVCDNKC